MKNPIIRMLKSEFYGRPFEIIWEVQPDPKSKICKYLVFRTHNSNYKINISSLSFEKIKQIVHSKITECQEEQEGKISWKSIEEGFKKYIEEHAKH